MKIAEAVQLLSVEESEAVFADDLLAVDVGAAPGGGTGYLANYNQEMGPRHVSVTDSY